MREKLKPCPFCGGPAEMKHVNHCYPWNGVTGAEGWAVRCSEPWCPAHNTQVYRVTEAEAVQAWNTRYERACTMEKKQTGCFTGLVCSKCGSTTFYRYTEPDEDGIVIGCPVPHYCPNCGAKVVDDGIR